MANLPMPGADHVHPAVQLRGVGKVYPGVTALSDFDLVIRPGEVSALVGENGAGKSTVVKIIAGAESASTGTVEVCGHDISGAGPHAARRAGVRVVYQELTVIATLTALENVFLGVEITRNLLLGDGAAMRRRYTELCEVLGVSIPAGAIAGTLSVSEQQSLEIMRALQGSAQVIILDEPTATLPVPERERLHAVVAELARRGVAIVFISHDLEEVLSVSDTITVLRNGARVQTAPTAEWTERSLIKAMLGRTLDAEPRLPQPSTRAARAHEEILRVEGLEITGRVRSFDLVARAGEILGLAGLVGSGRSEILRAIAGADRPAAGAMTLSGQATQWPRTPRRAQALGIVLAPEDRKHDGLVLGLSATDNMNLPRLSAAARRGVLSRRRGTAEACRAAARVGLPEGMLARKALWLSGGNQQKAVLGKWSASGARVFLVDEPTRGVDVGAKEEVFALLRELADAGAAVVLVSSELEEVTRHADRVVVVRGGRRVRELSGGDVTDDNVMQAMFQAEEV